MELQREVNVEQGFPEEKISVLILTSHWHADTYGMASLTRCLVNDLRFADPQGVKINITCALLEEERKISENDIDAAAKHNVDLRGAKRPRGDNKNKEPNIKWLDKYSVTYYFHIFQDEKYDFLIGHVPYLANGICNLKEFSNSSGHLPKVVFFVHALPKTQEGEVDREALMNWLDVADIVFWVGHAVKAEIEHCVDSTDSRVRGLYIPNVPEDLFTIEQKTRKSEGKQVITLMTNERKNLDVTGLHYELGMAAAVKAADSIIRCDGYNYEKQIRVEFLVLGVHPGERDAWKELFERIKKEQSEKKKDITFRFDVIKKTKDLQDFMKQTSVLLLPLKASLPLFGVEALAAAAAGTPFLVSSNSGIASLLQKIEETSPVIVNEGDLENDSLFWKKCIVDKIQIPEQAKSQSENIKLKLIQDTTIASSHLAFTRAVAEKACIQLTINIHYDSNSMISKDSIETASKFGVHFHEEDKKNIQAFITAFLTRLLHLREKIDLRLLDKELPDPVRANWERVLSFLEDKNRRVLDFREGSLVFLLFCPTVDSFGQLRGQQWQNEFQSTLFLFLTEIVPTVELTILETNPHIITTCETYLSTVKETTSTQLPDWQSNSRSNTKSLVTEMPDEQKVKHWQPAYRNTQKLELAYRNYPMCLHV